MKKLFNLSLLALVSVLLLNMSAYGQQDRGTISGVVTAQDSGEPIAGAMVRAFHVDGHHWPWGMAWTNSSGEYELSVPYGDYLIKAGKWRFFPEWWEEVPNREEATAVTVDEENNPDGINFTLEQIVFGGIAGTITDAATEEPIAWAWVVATGTEEPYPHRWAITDGNGEYEMELPSGTYNVEARSFGYVPGSIDEPVVVEDEVVTGVDIALMPIVYGSISGTVYDDATGEPIVHARIKARLIDGWYRRYARSDSEGNYILENLRPGDYRLTAHAWGYFPEVYPDTISVEGDENVPGIDFYLDSSSGPFDGFISGIVTDEESSEPVAGAFLVAVGSSSWHHFPVRFTHSGDDGSYIFENLPPSEYRVFCMASGYQQEFYEDKHSWWEADIVIPDAENIDFALTASEPGPRFMGGQICKNSIPVPGAIVTAKQNGEVKYVTVAHPDGSYGFEGIDAGIYDIDAISPSLNEGSLEGVVVLLSDVYDADVILSPTSLDDDLNLPVSMTLQQNYPNPFNASTEIKFLLPAQSYIRLKVFNILGQKTATLLEGRFNSGEHSIIWDAGDFPSGVYFARLETADHSESIRMVLLK
jgi:hypothetical protein